MKIDCSRQTWTARTDERRLALLGLLSEPKSEKIFLGRLWQRPQWSFYSSVVLLFLWPVQDQPWPGEGVVHQAGDVHWAVARPHCSHVQIPNVVTRVSMSVTLDHPPRRGVDDHGAGALDLVLEGGDLAGVQPWHLRPGPREIEGAVPLPGVSRDLVIQIYPVTHRAQSLRHTCHHHTLWCGTRDNVRYLLIYSNGDLFS